VSEFLAPSNASQAKAMRVGDIAGMVVPAGTVSKASKADDLLKAINRTDGIAVDAGRRAEDGRAIVSVSTDNLINPAIDAADADSVKFFENVIQRDGVDALGPIEVRVASNGTVEVVDGAKRLEAARNQNVDLVDVVTRQADETPVSKKADVIAPTATQKTDDAVKVMQQEMGGNNFDIAKPKQAERRFSQRVSESMPDANMEPQTFTRRNTNELSQKAQNLLDEQPDVAQRIIDEIKAGKSGSDVHTAVISEKLNRLRIDAENTTDITRKNDLYEEAATLANDVAERLTKAGQEIQAASLYGRLTPEGQARFSARSIQKWNAKNPDKKIPELGGKTFREISDEQKRINNMPDGEAKRMAQFNLQNKISDLTPTPNGTKIINTWKAGLLTGLKTSGLNIGSNTANFGLEIIKDIPAAMVDTAVAAVLTGERKKFFTARGVLPGMQDGVYKAKRYFFTGYDERNIGSKIDYRRVNFGNSKTQKAFQAYTDIVFRFIGAQDQPFYYATARKSIMDQSLAMAHNEGLRGSARLKRAYEIAESPSEEIMKYATMDAQMAVFQNETRLGEFAAGFQRLGTGNDPDAAQWAQLVLPFAKTPSAVAMQIVNYSPVGLVYTIIKNARKGQFDQRLFSEGIGRGIVGTAPLVIGAEMYKNGLISLDFPGGDQKQQQLDRAEGRTYNSFRTSKDGDWRTVMTLGPAGSLMLMGAYFEKAKETNGSPTGALVEAGLGMFKSFTEQTFLTGVNRVASAIMDPERYGQTILQDMAASFIPTIVSDVAQVNDEFQRESKGETYAETFKTRAMNRIPGARNELPIRIDSLGNKTPRSGNAVETMLDPTRPSTDRSNELTSELRRLMDEAEITGNDDLRVAPTKVKNETKISALNSEQSQLLWETVGGLVNRRLTRAVTSDGYEQLPDEEKAKLLSKITDKAKDYGRAQFLMMLRDGMTAEEEIIFLQDMKEKGIYNSSVEREYAKIRFID
jgi:hypothetical protein